MLAVVGSWRRKLQLLQPRAGVWPTPLSSAWAGPADDVAANNASGTAASPAMIPRMSLLIGPPRLGPRRPGARYPALGAKSPGAFLRQSTNSVKDKHRPR